MNVSKNFFLLSFFPALVYWYLENNYSFKVAITGGLICAIVELLLEKKFTGHLHQMSKLNFYLIIFLGFLSFLGEEGFWFKLQPAITGVVIGVYLLWKVKYSDGLFYEMIVSFNEKKVPPKEIINTMEYHSSFLFISYGVFMGFIAYLTTTETWLFFKTIGFYIIFILFMGIEVIIIRFKINKMIKFQSKREVLQRFNQK